MKDDVAPDSSSWVSALDAVHILAASFGDRTAKETLVSRLEDGILSLGARLAIEEADTGRLILDEDYWGWGEKPKSFPRQIGRSRVKLAADEAAFVDLGRDFFAKSGQWVIDTERFAWPQGIVVARRPAQIRRLRPIYRVAGTAKGEPPAVPANVSMRRAVAGLSFRLDEIRGILAGAPGHLAAASFEHADNGIAESESIAVSNEPAGASRKRGRSWDFGPAMSELEHRIREGTMNVFGPIDSLDAERAIKKYLKEKAMIAGKKPPSRNTVNARAKIVMAKWREADRNLRKRSS